MRPSSTLSNHSSQEDLLCYLAVSIFFPDVSFGKKCPVSLKIRRGLRCLAGIKLLLQQQCWIIKVKIPASDVMAQGELVSSGMHHKLLLPTSFEKAGNYFFFNY